MKHSLESTVQIIGCCNHDHLTTSHYEYLKTTMENSAEMLGDSVSLYVTIGIKFTVNSATS